MDAIKCQRAISTFESFTENLPSNKLIEAKYVEMYHNLLSDIQNEIDEDISYFRVPAEEVKPYVKRRASSYNPRARNAEKPVYYTDKSYCDRPMFLIRLNGAIKFLNAFLSEPDTPRLIGFVS